MQRRWSEMVVRGPMTHSRMTMPVSTSARTASRVVDDRDLAVLIPAHNEEDAIGATLDALSEQTAAPGRVIVVADNCTDATESIAAAHGAQVLRTVGNTARKAGALNQALDAIASSPPTFVLVVDADTRLSPRFVETALREMARDERIGAVSGLFLGELASGMLQQFQANEYERYRTQIRSTGRVAVVTGTASLFRLSALRDIAAHRDAELPGVRGDVYDRGAITEDSELTLALKTRGWRLVAPLECECYTELMPTWVDLHRQRVRWYKGMLDNLRSYGPSPVTLRYFGQQFMIGTGIITIAMLIVLTALSIAAGSFAFQPFWLALGAVFVVERILSVWPAGPKGRLVTAAVIPEIFYDLALQTAFVHAVWLAMLRRDTSWNHVTAARAPLAS
ncbi:glycosyltransferase family 2 protein [Microbacterium caowuchunii]|uniref:glycosyltransferase family 2 protein n=1 Tax=Microbacterium caowuchunii TaxID=2614638 RepID=UPI00193100F2|nr:glycosyltransferase family 2 protein [Microbacterium caowuchunii]